MKGDFSKVEVIICKGNGLEVQMQKGTEKHKKLVGRNNFPKLAQEGPDTCPFIPLY